MSYTNADAAWDAEHAHGYVPGAQRWAKHLMQVELAGRKYYHTDPVVASLTDDFDQEEMARKEAERLGYRSDEESDSFLSGFIDAREETS